MSYWQFTMIILIPVMIFAGFAQNKIHRTVKQYEKVPTIKGLTGAQVASSLLREQNITDVSIHMISGSLSDHYDPRKKTLGLSKMVYSGNSIASIGVAAHEVGHAIQHHQGYGLLRFRSAFAPAAQIGSTMAIPLIIFGFIIQWIGLAKIGIVMFSTVVVFQLVTVPVESNASRRALHLLTEGGYLNQTEVNGAKKVLSAAAMTYIASLLVSIAHLLRLVMLVRND